MGRQASIIPVRCAYALSHKRHRKLLYKNKRMKGRGIEERPAIVNERNEIGHWKVDTVVGKRGGRESVVFTAVEKKTRNYIAVRISGHTCAGVEEAMSYLQDYYGTERFSQIFKTMTADNGAEFEHYYLMHSSTKFILLRIFLD